MKRNIIYLLLAIIFFLGAVSFYINTVTIPKSLKKIVVQKAEEFLGRRVSLIDLHFNPLQGFIFTGITIYEKDSPDVFATVAQANVQLLYWPLMRKGKVVLSSLTMDTARLNLIHYASGTWNFADILEHRASFPRSKKSGLYVSKLKVINGRVLVTNLKESFQFSDDIKNIAVTLGLSVNKGILLNASASLNDEADALSINGTYHPLTQKLSAELKLSHFNPVNYYRFFQWQLPLTVDSLIIDQADLKIALAEHLIRGEGHLSLNHFTARQEARSLKADRLTLNSFHAEFKDGQITFDGAAAADNLQASDGASVFHAKSLAAQVARWTSRGNAIQVNASLNAQQAQINIPDKLAAQSNIQIKDLKISKEADRLSLTGGADMNNTVIQAPNLAAQSDIQIKDLKISREADLLSLTGGAEMNNTLIQAPNIEAKGNFSLGRVGWEIAGGTVNAIGNLSASNLNYRWPNHELTGNITLPWWKLKGQPGISWVSQSTFQGSALTITLPGGKSFQGDANGAAQFQLALPSRFFVLRSNFQLGRGLLTLSKKLSLNANPSGGITISPRKNPLEPLPYSGWLDFKGGTLDRTNIGPVENITGIVSFKNDQLETSELAVTALGMPVKVKGTLDNFSSPQLDLTARIDDFDLNAAQYVIPNIMKNSQLALSGKATNLVIAYRGGIASTKNAEIRLAADIQNGVVASPAFKDSLNGLSGAMWYADKTLAWTNMSVNFKDRAYTLTGKMITASPFTVDTTIEGEDLKLHARFNHSPKSLQFEQLSGRYKKAYVNVSGTSTKTADGSPFIDFTGDANIDLKDLPAMFPNLPEPLKQCGLSGQTDFKGRFAGDLRHWQDWQYNLTGSAPEFAAWGFHFTNIKFNAVQQNNLLKPFHIWGDFYNGEINLVASVDTSKKELPMDLVVRILNSDLNKLRLDTPLKKHSIAGQLSFTGIFNGSMTALQNVNGKGGIEIQDGVLWEIDLLKGLSGILLIPEYKDIIFTQAGMNYAAENGLITTDNIQLIGPTLSLYGKGSLDLTQDQAIKLWLTPDFNADVILKSSSLKKSTTAIITGTEKFMSVEVTGTLSKPEYKVNKSPVKILQKTGGVILDNVSQFFQNIF